MAKEKKPKKSIEDVLPKLPPKVVDSYKQLPDDLKARINDYLLVLDNTNHLNSISYIQSVDGFLKIYGDLQNKDKASAKKKAEKQEIKDREEKFLEFCKGVKDYNISLEDIVVMIKEKIKIQEKLKIQAEIEKLTEKLNSL